jgi:hypothetical protein
MTVKEIYREATMGARKGGCLCGAVRYEIKTEPTMTAVCHCTHCQRQSGAMFSANMVVMEADYTQHGQTKVYEDKGDSGQAVYRHFCGNCGSPILSKVAVMPGVLMVKMGTLDDASGITPAIEVYTDHAAAWVGPVAGAQRFAQSTS